MFSDMGVEIDEAALAPAFRRWLGEALPTGVYRAWIVEDIANVEKIEDGSGPIVGGISSLARNASADGQPLYESMGYQWAPNPMMYLALGPIGLLVLTRGSKARK